jgi:hypothetical protein
LLPEGCQIGGKECAGAWIVKEDEETKRSETDRMPDAKLANGKKHQ